MEQGHEVVLTGGDVTEGVVRAGDTVRRPLRAHSPAVHGLLGHLERVGFEGAPRFLGIDELGREVLTWMPGETPGRPMREYAATEEALRGVARLLRRFHDAVSMYEAPPDAPWDVAFTTNVDDPPELIGHCDVTPDNVVFRDGVPYGLIDFDLARPTTRLFDVVNTLRTWAPLADPADRDEVFARLDADAVGRRIRRFCDAYGLGREERRRVLPVARLRFERSYLAMRARAERLGGGWERMWRGGIGVRIRRGQDWLEQSWDVLDARLG
ncbi:Phosphotransferase enzyme family protein [Thermomonospora echinospora]|uniref:Phosphotransferase enzyme family protein n=1 Tax=Thermomonospora echinospora TaxID=1992 RepID=A0A1H6B6C5_9ACTN|nr:Phosphotransferase enzyme family protein [Thermomonospora echinospora]